MINPGIGGGANWGGAAFDPESGFKYMVRSTFPLIDSFPVLKPPWGSFTAYDLNTGTP